MIKEEIQANLAYLSEIYQYFQGPKIEIAICGGTALNLTDLVLRPTKDVDVLFPEIWPKEFHEAVRVTADHFQLEKNWINQGPVDLFRMGLPSGYFDRCHILQFHPKLKYLLTSRFDQIHFKLYACVDRGGYHIQDLKKLNPSCDELVKAARWTQTHDVSAGFKQVLFSFLKSEGWDDVVARLGI